VRKAAVFGKCRLCLEHRELKDSHILSGLVYRWFRRSQRRRNRPFVMVDTVTDRYRRIQDGLRAPFCCWSCEQELGRAEHQFRERFFAPYIGGRTSNLEYGSWLSRFAAANAWRVLQYHLEEVAVTSWSPSLRSRGQRAAEHWRRFLRGEVAGLGKFRLHLVELTADFAPKLYVEHVVNSVIAEDRATGNQFVFIKFGALLLVAVIYDSAPRNWRHTAINERKGIWNQHRAFRLPAGVIGYVAQSAREAMSFARRIRNG
jgi:hypothetical protein